MNNQLNIIFSSDNNYAQYMGVAICSMFENNKSSNQINIHVIDGGIDINNKNKLSILENRYNFKINYIEIDKSLFKDFYIFGHFTQAAYYRIVIAELLPNIDKILYIDCDLIINNDINDLYSTNIENYYLAAVDEGVKDRQKELNIPENNKYFNSGVMLINLKKWRNSNLIKDITDFIKNNPEKLSACDQDALNAILYDKWLLLDEKFNYTSKLYYEKPIKTEEIVILHFTGLKPWNYLCDHKLKYLYFNYLNKTPWKNKKYIDRNFVKILRKVLRNLLNDKYKNIIKKLIK